MRCDKQKAIALRLTGKSYREIRSELDIPLSTLSNWFMSEKWSKDIAAMLTERNRESSRRNILSFLEKRRNRLQLSYADARIQAVKEFEKLKGNPLFIAAIALYWGEGDKRSLYKVGVANTDPVMIKVFFRFLREICDIPIEKIKVWLLLYPDLDEEECKMYWRMQGNLSSAHFYKSTTIKGKVAKRKIGYGVCTVFYVSRILKEKMLIWTALLGEELSGNKAGIV